MPFSNVKQNLEQLGYTVSCFETADAATAYLDLMINKQTVGFGGSMTIQQMGLYEKLEKHNYVKWHWRIPEGQNAQEVHKEAAAAKIYISSVNGLAETGEIINIDGVCNRVSAIMYGHKKVYLIAGINKLAENYDKALERSRNIAAPLNAQRLNKKTPCAEKADKCYNCKSPDRICCGLSVLYRKPMGADFEIILINEHLGF